MTVKLWQSVCMVCGEIYQIRIVNDNSHYNANGMSNGICPECERKRKEEKMKKKWRYRCLICGKKWGDEDGKLLQTFCIGCQKKIRNSDVLKDYLDVVLDEGDYYET